MAKTNKANGSKRAPVDRVERWPIAKLIPYARNPRLHSPEQIDQIAASMMEFGQAQLVVVDNKGEIIAGHGRVLAAQALGWKSLMVGIAVGWSDVQKRAYRIADNQIGLTSRWDDQLLRMEFNELKLEDCDLKLLGFDEGQLKGFALAFDAGETSASDEWRNMPEFEQIGGSPFRTIRVLFPDQQSVDRFAKALKRDISPTASFFWFPEGTQTTSSDKKFTTK